MSWTLPKAKFGANYLLDNEEYNDNLAQVAAELSGNLNEHNYVNRALKSVMENGKAAADIGLQIYSKKKKLDPHLAVTSLYAIPQSERWAPIDDTTIQWTSRGGKALVIYSFQCRMEATISKQSGLNFCIEIDGTPFMQSLLGTGDQGNDFLDATANVLFGTGTVQYDYGTSPSFRANQSPHLVAAVIPVSPGQHTVRLLARNLFTVSAVSQFMSQREGIVLDGWC